VDAFFQALRAGQSATVLELLQTNPDLPNASHPQAGLTALHIAARRLDVPLVRALLGLGANPTVTCRKNNTPLDWAAHSAGIECQEEFEQIAALLQAHGAQQTAASAAAAGDVPWLTVRHREGTLENHILDTGGLLRIAVSCRHRAVLELLLGFGWDPDERVRFGDPEGDEPEYTQGMPLYRCAGTGNYEYAELLLNHGANPNASVYASGDPVFQAFSRRDWPMVELLARHGGIPCASTAGLFRQTALGLRMLSGEAPYRLERPHGLAEELLWGAACGGDVELVRQSLERIDWPKDDPRWFDLLEQPLRVWDHGGNNGDRSTYPACFALILERVDPNLPGRQEERGFGLTLLHSVAGSREHLTPEERRTFATLLLEAGANLTVRDNLLKSTPLGWACRWGRPELVELFLHHGADPLEPTADPWATPRAWATRKNHPAILALLESWIDGGTSNSPPKQ
jgi:ankyrin repeat protein